MLKREALISGYSPNGFHRMDLKPSPESRIVFVPEMEGVASEQYRLLRKSLSDQFPDGGVLLVTSPTKGDGKTMNVANLGWCLAEAGAPTLVIEADLRQPSLSEVLGHRPHLGVEAVLRGEVEPEAAVAVASNGLPLHFATVAKAQSDPVQLLRGPGTKKLIEWARSKFFWVLLDCPPIIPAADVAELAPYSDAVFLVVRVRSTPVDLIRKSFQMLGDRLKGVILNEATRSQDSYYHYLSKYYSGKQT